jgi:nitroimidazol reductase NimA-like FMN-containing flavoprotein (pyridoxamine 5'-phosphate oxidase superfamily)
MTDTAPQPITDLPLTECWEHLRRGTIGRLAVINGNRPDVFPVNYVIDEDRIVIRTAEGAKLAAAIASGEVAFEIDEFDLTDHTGWSVVAHGLAQEPKALAAVMHDQELDLRPWAGREGKERFIEIVPTHVTGRRLHRPN